MKRRSLFGALLLFLCFYCVDCSAQTSPSLLTIDRIFGSSDFLGQRFGPARWIKDGSHYLTVEPSKDTPGASDIVRYDAASGEREIFVAANRLIPSGAKAPLRIEDYELSPDGNMLKVFTNGRRSVRTNTRGDYWILELSTNKLWQLGNNPEPSTLMFAKFSPDNDRVAYVQNDDIFVEDLRNHKKVQLTKDGSSQVINGAVDWAYEEELDVKDGFRWSPDSKSIAFWQLDTTREKEFSMIDDTDSLYPTVRRYKYPKVGEPIASARVGVVDINGGKVRWLKIPGDPADQYIVRMAWVNNPQAVVVQRINRRQNQLDVLIADPRTGDVRNVLTERDDTWVALHDDPRWLDGDKSFLWTSERDGWEHVYRVSRSGGEPQLITRGDYDVISVQAVDERQGWLYYITSPDNPTQRHLYRVRLDGQGAPQRISPSSRGVDSYSISPNAEWAFHTHSTFDDPPTTDLVRLPQHESVRVLAANSTLRAHVAALKRVPTEFFRVDIGDGVKLDGWAIKPPDMQPGKRYPLLVYVYGEPAGQTVVDQWGGATLLWHLLLAQHGYVVVSVDSRGTPAPRGRAWRKSIYRQIGILASADQAAAVKAITQWPFIDPQRVGVWGWSGGGSMTLNAMFRYPDLYQTGMAVASVPQQRLYDAPYQERYMGLLSENPEGYKQGSPITFAENLKGNLLIVHGTGDDNVHYQGVEELINELAKDNKQFTMMAYPNRTHGIWEGANTSRHLRYLLTNYLEEHMPPGPR